MIGNARDTYLENFSSLHKKEANFCMTTEKVGITRLTTGSAEKLKEFLLNLLNIHLKYIFFRD